MGDILVITEHLKGEFQDITFEMLGKAKELAGASGGQCIAVTFGNMNGKAGELGMAHSVVSVGGSDDFNPESYAAAVQSVVSAKSPSLVMVGSTSMGMDIANSVATALDITTVSYCADMSSSDGGFSVTSSMYGGKMNVVTDVSGSAVAMVSALIIAPFSTVMALSISIFPFTIPWTERPYVPRNSPSRIKDFPIVVTGI